MPFGWDYVEGNQELGVEICFIGYLRTKFDTQVVKINLEKQKTENYMQHLYSLIVFTGFQQMVLSIIYSMETEHGPTRLTGVTM